MPKTHVPDFITIQILRWRERERSHFLPEAAGSSSGARHRSENSKRERFSVARKVFGFHPQVRKSSSFFLFPVGKKRIRIRLPKIKDFLAGGLFRVHLSELLVERIRFRYSVRGRASEARGGVAGRVKVWRKAHTRHRIFDTDRIPIPAFPMIRFLGKSRSESEIRKRMPRRK